jgi:hypothetical protein
MAAVTVWAPACVGAGVLLAAGYLFHFKILWQGVRAAKLLDFTAAALSMSETYRSAAGYILKGSPLLIVLLPAALLGYVLWRRARYFGNTAPLLMAAICLALGVAAPTFSGRGFLLVAMPFLFAFVAGVCADLLETRFGSWLRILLTAALSGYAFWSLVALAQV